MLVNIQDDMIELQKLGLLDKLLVDKTTKGHILWGTDAYSERGEAYAKGREIFVPLVLYNNLGVIKTRARKAFEQQLDRTKLHGEVFTPRWVCNMMIDAIDCDWFGIDKLPIDAWQHVEELFQQVEKSWKKYVDNRRLEITCGEAPYLVQRYDVADGEMIPVEERTGILDRKLHVISACTTTVEEWIHWGFRAVESTYGYEYQGDNLLIARVNVMKTFMEHYQERWKEKVSVKLLSWLVNKVVWNLWQMDGLTDSIPCDYEDMEGPSLFEMIEPKEIDTQLLCKVYDWHRYDKSSFPFVEMKGRQKGMKFDYVIGNPPYQEETESDSTRKPPIYNAFMDESFKMANVVELITPARFLFRAGYTPKAWNEKMLNDEHFKIMYYEPISSKIFANTDIKGGVCISLRNANKKFGAIVTFTKYPLLNDILKKVQLHAKYYLDTVISSPLSFKLSKLMLKENPNTIGRLRTSAFSTLGQIFYEEKPNDNKLYIQMIGLLNGNRVRRFVRKDYIVDSSDTLDKYTLLVPKAVGSGAFGETLSSFECAEPGVGYTQTFISIGKFSKEYCVKNLSKYLKGKFARALLGVLKITQDCPGPKWKWVPLQDFTEQSDIDWSQTIADIDKQLYKKYGLSQEEIDFIEKNVKEMK